MYLKLYGYICALLVLTSCASPQPSPLILVDAAPSRVVEPLEFAALDKTKDAFENSIFYDERVKAKSNYSNREFISLLNVKTLLKNERYADFEGKT